MEKVGSLETSFYMTRRGHVLEEGCLLLVINTVRKSLLLIEDGALTVTRYDVTLKFQIRHTARTLLLF
jgi:hypothetical protein